jgi:hypothetical protein
MPHDPFAKMEKPTLIPRDSKRSKRHLMKSLAENED